MTKLQRLEAAAVKWAKADRHDEKLRAIAADSGCADAVMRDCRQALDEECAAHDALMLAAKEMLK
jgi:hypothetical protein